MADLYRDFVFTRNTVQVTDTDTTVQVEDVSLFPSNALLAKSEFYLAFDSTLTYPHTFEIVRLLSVNVGTKTLTIERGQAGTTALPHAIVTYIKGTLNSDQVERIRSGERGTTAPTPDFDVFSVGDRFYHTSEGRFYAFTGNASYLRDTFTRTASTTTMGSTEVQTLTGEIHGILPPQYSQIVPYTARWTPNDNNIFGINADGRAYLVSGVAGACSYVNVGSTNFDVTFDVFMSSTAGSDYGILFRADADLRNGYYLGFSGTTVTLRRMINGAFSDITTAAYVAGAFRNWRIWVDGNVIRILRTNAAGLSEQVINYTEATTGFILGSATYRPGGNVGIYYRNAAAIGDASIVWDGFTCTTPDNVGLNNPKPQGWAPVSSLLGPLDSSGYQMRQLARLQADLSNFATWTDDLLDITRDMEASQASQSRDIATIALHLDEWLDTWRSSFNAESLASAFAHSAGLLDEVIDILSTLVRSQPGPPGGVPRDGEIYIDNVSKTIYGGLGGVWKQLTYSGPDVVIPDPIFVAAAKFETSNRTFTIPAGAQAGDLAIVSVNTVHSSSPYEAPVGWTLIRNGAYTTSNVNGWGVFYKQLTADDLGATHTFTGNSYTSDSIKHVRVYRNAVFADPAHSNVANRAMGSGTRTMSTDPFTPTRPGLLLTIFQFSTYGSSMAVSAPQSNLLLSSSYSGQQYINQASQEEVIDANEVGTPVTRSVETYHGGYYTNGSGVVLNVFLSGTGALSQGPAFILFEGAPTRTDLQLGSVHFDLLTGATYVYTVGGWLGVNQRVVKAKGDYAAKGNDYILADTTQSGRSSFAVTYDNAITNFSGSNPTTMTLATTHEDVTVVAARMTWGGSGFSGTVNGEAMTMRRRQQANGYTGSDMFTSVSKVQPGNQTVVLSGGVNYGINFAGAMGIRGIDPATGVYVGASYTSTLALPLPVGVGGIIVLFAANNSTPVPTISNGGGLTWTDRGGANAGSNASSRWWTAEYTPAQAGTTVTVVVTPNDTNYGHIQAAIFPAAGDPTLYDANNYSVITLPTPNAGGRVTVQSNDEAGNEIRIVPASGTINGQPSDVLATRYLGAIYTSDGTNWFKLATGGGGGGGGSSATLVTKTANYSARAGEIILMDATTGPLTVSLPSAALSSTLTVKKVDATANSVTITPTSGTIDGQASLVINGTFDSYDLVGDGANWWLI